MNRRAFARASAAAIIGCAYPLRRAFAGASASAGRALLVPRPTPAQLAWQREELAMFVHFGMNTFTNREWGDGSESPGDFAPFNLDTRQWARAAREGGFRSLILTAKHHDGFCLWPSNTTQHTVAASPWRGGAGDLVREFVDACRAEELNPGVYLSPWDRNNPSYGNSPRYNDLYAAQLTELLTRYGPMAEVWFDGANGEGPNGKKQTYDWPRIFGIVRDLQPDAVIFSDAGPDVRWCGNERGIAGDPNWSTVDPSAVPYPGASGGGIIDALQHGDPEGSVWRPAEADVSIRPGWFHHPAEDSRVRTVDDLEELYFSSVGRNSKLLLNVPPTREGVLHSTDVARLAAFRQRLSSTFEQDLARGAKVTWRATGQLTAQMEIELARDATASIVRLAEDIKTGQAVSSYSLMGMRENGWRDLASGTTIGYTRLHRIHPIKLRRVRLIINGATLPPQRVSVGLFTADAQ